MCIECSTRLEPHTDQSVITEYMREREDAVRKQRPANPMLSTPGTGINRNRQRVRFEGADEQRETSSAASALRNTCKQMVKRAEAWGLGDLENIVENPIDAYSTSRVGLSVSSLAELATYAHIRIPDIGERAKGGAGRHGSQQVVDARMAYVWPPGAQTLDLLTKCLISFQDRFYKLDEIAVVIFEAIKSNRVPGFLILDFSGNVEEFVGNIAVVQIMTRLGNMFDNNRRRAANRGEHLPTLQFDGQLRIPEGFASLGDRQLNAIMANTRFFKEYGKNAMENWFSRAHKRSTSSGRKAWTSILPACNRRSLSTKVKSSRQQ